MASHGIITTESTGTFHAAALSASEFDRKIPTKDEL